MELSLILPVFNSAAFIRANVARALEILRGGGFSFEIIAVNDASTDGTAQELRAVREKELRVIELPRNQGKFGALTAGMCAAAGDCCVFCDADLPYSLDAVPYIMQLINRRQFHIVVGDRSLAESRCCTAVPLLRKISSLLFSNCVRLVLTGQIFDSQCGLKGFRRDVAHAIFPLLRERGFAGDVELIYIALKYNLEIRRIPVRLTQTSPSTVRLLQDAPRLLSRLISLPVAWRLGWYKSKALEHIARQDY